MSKVYLQLWWMMVKLIELMAVLKAEDLVSRNSIHSSQGY